MRRRLALGLVVVGIISFFGQGSAAARAEKGDFWTDELNLWLDTLPADVWTMEEAVDPEAKLLLVGGLSYLLRKIEIVPDYLEGVGLVDDAAVLRVAAGLAVEAGLEKTDPKVRAAIELLAEEGELLEPELGEMYYVLRDYVARLPYDPVNGYTAVELLKNPELYELFLMDLKDEIESYSPKPITDGDRALRELKSFIKADLDK